MLWIFFAYVLGMEEMHTRMHIEFRMNIERDYLKGGVWVHPGLVIIVFSYADILYVRPYQVAQNVILRNINPIYNINGF